jgi:hypothetical protein
MGYTLTHIYNDYKKYVENAVDSTTFKNICGDFNIEIMEYILEGKEFNMGYNLSTLSIVRMKRDPRAPRIDWSESNKYKQELKDMNEKLYDKDTEEGVKWQIYFTDEYYYKYYWRKGKCLISNKSVYRFDPTRGLKGNKEKLTRILQKDDLAYLKFKKYN